MTTGLEIAAGPKMERAELLARVASLTPLIEEYAARSEVLGTLAPEVAAALRQAGLFRLWSASEVGGYDINLADQLEILVAVAQADMSTCWSLMISASSSAVMAARLPNEGVSQLFGDGPWPTAAASLNPSGRARRGTGGYRVSGRWGFGSGSARQLTRHAAPPRSCRLQLLFLEPGDIIIDGGNSQYDGG